MINRVPVFPAIGNHDRRETEGLDDRDQLTDNLYLTERFAARSRPGERRSGRACSIAFRVGADVEFVCIDTSKQDFFRRARLFEHPKHWLIS